MDCKTIVRSISILLALWGSICLIKGWLWHESYLLKGRWGAFFRRLIDGLHNFTTNLPMWNDLYVGLGCLIIAAVLELALSWVCYLN